MRLANEIGRAPAIVLVCATSKGRGAMGSVIPSVQNLLLAATGLGLGTCYTSHVRAREQEVKELLGVPDGWAPIALITLGYLGPGERFGGGKRKPLEEVVSYEHWGQHAP